MRKRVNTLIRVFPDSGLGASDIAFLISGVIVALIFSAMPDPRHRVGLIEPVPTWVKVVFCTGSCTSTLPCTV